MKVTVWLKKASTVYQMLRRKIFKSRNLSKSTKVRVFWTMVMSTLLCSTETWPVTQKEIHKLTTFQMQFLRDIQGLTLWDRCRNADVMEECGEAAMRDQLRFKRLQWFGHLMQIPTHRPQWQILKCRPQGKWRPPGRTPLTWIDVVHKDLTSPHNWHQMVNDRTTWRAFIRHPLDGHLTTSSA